MKHYDSQGENSFYYYKEMRFQKNNSGKDLL
jgi:hypothetical protein